jgi:hypothetical protein
MIYLRQSTASQEIPLGYFLDSANGNDEETGLTINNTDIKLWKIGATSLANKNSGGGTHISNGIYYAVLDATDTNTVGSLVIFCHVAGALAVKVECCVLDEAVYDVLFGTVAPSTYAGADTAGTTTLLSRVGVPADLGSGATVAANLTDIEGQTDDIGAAGAGLTAITGKTDALPSDPADQSLIIAATDAILLRLPAVLVGGRMSSDVGSISGDAAAADNAEAFFDGTGYPGTNNVIPSVTTVTGNVDGSVAGGVGSVAAPVTVGTNNDKTGYRLSVTGVDDVLDEVVEGAYTMRQFLRLFASALAAKLSGAATATVTIRDVSDTKNRIVATVDADGNRAAVVLDVT